MLIWHSARRWLDIYRAVWPGMSILLSGGEFFLSLWLSRWPVPMSEGWCQAISEAALKSINQTSVFTTSATWFQGTLHHEPVQMSIKKTGVFVFGSWTRLLQSAGPSFRSQEADVFVTL